jgi:DNA segregation ATPase FtsK/SpoIIIE-like protein
MAFYIKDEARDRHIYIAGKAGSGKSTLIFWMVMQDIARGKGTCLIDPHGDLVTDVLNRIPKSRLNDVIYLDARSPVPLDFMAWETNEERDRLTDDLMVMFKRFFENTAGDRWQSILQWTIHTLLEAEGCTFLDLYYFLADPAKRQTILDRVTVPEIRQYWREHFPHLPKDAATPITTRMSKFLLTPSLRTILGSPKPKLNLYDHMQVTERRPVLLVNLGGVGQETGNLLGALIVSKLQQAAMRRQHIPIAQRIPFYLYVDEFQHFQTSAFDVILSEARKYKLCLALAHQYVGQLEDNIRRSILGNVGTFILFRLHEQDAQYFKGELPREPEPSPQSKYRKKLIAEREKIEVEIGMIRKRFERHPEFVRLPEVIARMESQTHGINSRISELPPEPKQGPTAESIPRLPRFNAIYKDAKGDASIIRTPKPPAPPTEEQVRNAEIIRKRTVEKYACEPAPNVVQSKEDEPQPTGKPNVPHHRHKKAGA